MFRIKLMSTSCKIVLRSVPQNLTDVKSTLVQVMAWYIQPTNHTLVQVMAWYLQPTNHYLGQCWSRYLSPHGAPNDNDLSGLGQHHGVLSYRNSTHGALVEMQNCHRDRFHISISILILSNLYSLLSKSWMLSARTWDNMCLIFCLFCISVLFRLYVFANKRLST